MMSDWKVESLRHKYDPLPEDAPRHKKKRRKKHVRSDHKHEYEDVVIECHSHCIIRGKKHPTLFKTKRCKICGKFRTYYNMPHTWEPPSGMRRFEVKDFLTMSNIWFKDKVLSDKLEARDWK